MIGSNAHNTAERHNMNRKDSILMWTRYRVEWLPTITVPKEGRYSDFVKNCKSTIAKYVKDIS